MDAQCEIDIRKRITMAERAFKEKQTVLANKNIQYTAYFPLFKVTITRFSLS